MLIKEDTYEFSRKGGTFIVSVAKSGTVLFDSIIRLIKLRYLSSTYYLSPMGFQGTNLQYNTMELKDSAANKK